MKVLVIDDEIEICNLIHMALKIRGYEVKYSTTGAGGITLFGEYQPAIVFLDLTLPDMNGLEVARKIREAETGKNTPILLMSGRTPELTEADSSLFACVLEKPFSIGSLEPLLKKYVT